MKIPNTRVQSISGWWTYWGVARVVCLERAWKLYPTPLPIHTRLMVCIFSIWLFLYNRPLNVSNMLSWILWAILTNYGTGAGAGMWEPLIYSQSFRSVGDSGLAIGVRSWEAALWDWVLSLWGLWWLWVVGVRIELNYAGSDVKNLSAMQETQVWSLDWEDPLEKEMATHSSIPAWRIPWTEEPGVLWPLG